MSEWFGQLRKFVAPEIIFGNGSADRVPDYARNFGAERVLLVTDPGVVRCGWTQPVVQSLRSGGVGVEVFSEVGPNPDEAQVAAGARAFEAGACDMIVAVGGGSPIDCAKGIGIVSSNQATINHFAGVDRVPVPMPPLVAVPTTAGSSADVSQFAIIRDRAAGTKYAIISKGIVPDVSLIDPRLSVTLDRTLTAETGMDALTHAIESYVSTAAGPLTRLYALRAIELIRASLPRAVSDPENLEARADMMMASLFAGLSFSNAGLGLVHGMAHALGGRLDLPHGLCNALILEHVCRYNASTTPALFRDVLVALGDDSAHGLPGRLVADHTATRLRDFRASLGLGGALSVRDGGYDPTQLSKRALADPCTATNPREPALDEVEELFRHVLT